MPFETFYNLPVDKRNKIMKAAMAEFADKGYQGALIESIANRAGVAKGSMYQYFENKKELFIYTFDFAVQSKLDYVNTVIEANIKTPYFELIEKLLIKSIDYARENPYTYTVYQDTIDSAPIEIRQQIDKKITELGKKYYLNSLLEASHNGELQRNINLELAAFVVYTLLKEFGQFILKKYDWSTEEEIRKYIKDFIKILKNGIEN